MIEEEAQVIAVDGDRLLLQAQTQSACGSCSASKGCGTSVLSKVVGRRFSRFEAGNTVGARLGDTVVVGLSEAMLLKASLMMYLLPVLAMIVFALLAEWLLAANEGLVVLSALGGLFAGALLARGYFSRGGVQRFSPVVLRKLPDHAKLRVSVTDRAV